MSSLSKSLLILSPLLLVLSACDEKDKPSDTATTDTNGIEDTDETDTAIIDTEDTEDTSETDSMDTGESEDTAIDTGDTDTGTPIGPGPNAVPDFLLADINPASSTMGQNISPRDYLQQISGWYFIKAT